MPTPLSAIPPQLNLPPAPLSMRHGLKGVETYDVLRRKWIVLTSEEWVRQHFVHFLIIDLGYKESLMANEVSITLNSTSKRCDTVIYDARLNPLMIIEYKAPAVNISRQTFYQILRYNTVLRVPYLVVSNGLRHYCVKTDLCSNSHTMLDHIPTYDELLNQP